MSWYSRTVLPALVDWCLDNPSLGMYRKDQLALVHGKVLEIGFGTGINIPYYPDCVRTLTTVDRNASMSPRAQSRIQESSMMVDHWILSAERLPMTDHAFDTVVSTLTLCSIKNVSQALEEVFRVLKPGGQFLFLEHGLSPDHHIQKWQRYLTPISRMLGDGCHLNRNIAELVETQPFSLKELQTFYLEDSPKILGYFYRGIALKPS